MGFARMLATLLFVVALPVAIVTTNVRLLANAPIVYRYAFDHYDAETTTGLSRTDLDSTAVALREYFNSGDANFYHTVTQGGLQTPVLNARETRHMHDVKRLFVFANRAQEFALVYILAYVALCFLWTREASVRHLAAQSLAGLAVGAAALGAIGVFAAFGFDAAFTRFHSIVFTNSDWRLDPATDHLIQMFPEPFWRDMTVLLGLMCAGEGLVIALISSIYLLGSGGERRRLPSTVATEASHTQAA